VHLLTGRLDVNEEEIRAAARAITHGIMKKGGA
jgi:hypothetical protein